MSAAAERLVANVKHTLADYEAMVALVLAKEADEVTHACTITIKEIMAKANPPIRSRTTVTRYLKTLEQRGLIHRDEQRRGKATAQTRYAWPACLEEPLLGAAARARVIEFGKVQQVLAKQAKAQATQLRAETVMMRQRLSGPWRAHGD